MPEIQPLWAPYQAALKAVAAERDKKLANLDNIYLLNLDKMKKERAEAVDLDGALAVKAEMDRLGAHQATSEEQRNAMPLALRALRGSYDAALKGYLDEAARSDAAALQKYLVDLDGLQKRITMSGDLKKALVVMAEREGLMARTSHPQPVPIAPEVKVAPVVGSSVPKFGTARIADATKDRPFENSLGMRFVPVPITGGPTNGQRVLFSIWETRAQDYQAFVKSKHVEWRGSGRSPGPTHPATQVTWEDARASCEWLTERERQGGRLGRTEWYRLPTDHEWSCAVGIGDREDPEEDPRQKSMKIKGEYPWGKTWPRPPDAGNYIGSEDGFPGTAPVGSFKANALGVFDLGGNVREFCEDPPGTQLTQHITRGAAFNAGDASMLSSSRIFADKGFHPTTCGFRVVLSTTGPVR